MSGLSSRSVPAPGQAPLVAPNAAALLRRNATESGDRVAIKFGDRTWTHARVLRGVEPVRGAVPGAAARRRAAPRRGAARQHARLPLRVRWARRSSAVRSSASTTRAATSTCCATRSTRTAGSCSPSRATKRCSRRSPTGCRPSSRRPGSPMPTIRRPRLGESLADALAAHDDASDPGLEPDIDCIWALIFTSGTSDSPKAVICSQRRLLVTGKRMSMIMDLGGDDVGYVCMPLFHSNAVQVGWAPSLVVPCAVGLGRRFSASGWLPDIRRYGSTYFNYTGKPLAYLLAQPEAAPTTPTTRCASPSVTKDRPRSSTSFSRRFGVEVIDAYGATEGGIAVNRSLEMPPGAIGLAPDNVQDRRRRRQRDWHGQRSTRRGRVLNADECVGEIVNTQGVGTVRGLLQQRGSDREDDAQRVVLVGRSRLQGSRRLHLLRGTQRRLDSRRRRELPGRARSKRRCARRRALWSPRSTACPTTRPATR